MDKSIKKGKVNNKIYDVVNLIEYVNINKDMYGPIAIEHNGYLYPEKNINEHGPGIYPGKIISYVKHPETEKEKDEYKSEGNIIDFKSSNIKELIQKSNKLKNMEREILTNPDNITIPPLLKNDEPEMRALKEAIIAKEIDLNKYAPRFGNNFQNDRRLLSNNRITMDKMKRMLNILDMKATLIIEDKSPDVPNPIGRKIEVELVGGEDIDE